MPRPSDGKKECPQCHEDRDWPDGYYKDPTTWSGRKGKCKQCVTENNKRYNRVRYANARARTQTTYCFMKLEGKAWVVHGMKPMTTGQATQYLRSLRSRHPNLQWRAFRLVELELNGTEQP